MFPSTPEESRAAPPLVPPSPREPVTPGLLTPPSPSGLPLADDQLPVVLAMYGAQWKIERETETGVWTAIKRPTPSSLHLLVAHDLAVLTDKLRRANPSR